MALFSGEADGAVHGAIRMWDALGTLNEERTKRGEAALRIGVGINTGRLLLGAIGSHKRLDSNVVGDAANLASRVESMTKVYGVKVLISGSTHASLSSLAGFTLRELDRVIVAGKTEPVVIHELLDEAAALYIGRCVDLIAQPPAGVWDGTTVLKGK